MQANTAAFPASLPDGIPFGISRIPSPMSAMVGTVGQIRSSGVTTVTTRKSAFAVHPRLEGAIGDAVYYLEVKG
jgi:hypothetical protein